jgi:hypothetical protein
MAEAVGEGLEELADRIAQLSERQAANARILLEEIQRHRSEAREQGRNFSAPTGAQVLDQLLSARSPYIFSLFVELNFLTWNGQPASRRHKSRPGGAESPGGLRVRRAGGHCGRRRPGPRRGG